MDYCEPSLAGWLRIGFRKILLERKLMYPKTIITIIMIMVTGCAYNKPSGPSFTNHVLSSPDKALVYFYRPNGESYGYNRTYFLIVNEQKVTDLLHGGYYPYEANPGKLSLVSDVNKNWLGMIPADDLFIEAAIREGAATLNIEVEAGKTYYIKMQPDIKTWSIDPRLIPVGMREGENEIKNCQLIKPKDFE